MRSTILLASLLAIVPFVSATPSRSQAARRSTPTFANSVSLSGGGSFHILGGTGTNCFTDSENNRALKNEFTPPNGITPESCCNECNDNGFILAGVENQGSSCFCDNEAGVTGNVDSSNCEEPCFEDGSTFCGGFNFMIMYQKDGT